MSVACYLTQSQRNTSKYQGKQCFFLPHPTSFVGLAQPNSRDISGIRQTAASFPDLPPMWVDSGNLDAVFLPTCMSEYFSGSGIIWHLAHRGPDEVKSIS